MAPKTLAVPWGSAKAVVQESSSSGDDESTSESDDESGEEETESEESASASEAAEQLPPEAPNVDWYRAWARDPVHGRQAERKRDALLASAEPAERF